MMLFPYVFPEHLMIARYGARGISIISTSSISMEDIRNARHAL
jgi:hypothetical protein